MHWFTDRLVLTRQRSSTWELKRYPMPGADIRACGQAARYERTSASGSDHVFGLGLSMIDGHVCISIGHVASNNVPELTIGLHDVQNVSTCIPKSSCEISV